MKEKLTEWKIDKDKKEKFVNEKNEKKKEGEKDHNESLGEV